VDIITSQGFGLSTTGVETMRRVSRWRASAAESAPRARFRVRPLDDIARNQNAPELRAMASKRRNEALGVQEAIPQILGWRRLAMRADDQRHQAKSSLKSCSCGYPNRRVNYALSVMS
jgi:hypothetical protein